MRVDDKTLDTMVNAYHAHDGASREAMRSAVECIHVACPPRDELAHALRQTFFVRPNGEALLLMPLSEIDEGSRQTWLRVADRAVELCAARLPAEVWGLVERWRSNDWPHSRHPETECAAELEAALRSTGQAAPKPALLSDDLDAYADLVVCKYHGIDRMDGTYAERKAKMRAALMFASDQRRDTPYVATKPAEPAQANEADRELALVVDWIRTAATVMPSKFHEDLACELEARRHRGPGAPKPVEPAPHLTPEAAARVLSCLTGGDDVLFPAEALAAAVNAELAKRPAEPAPRELPTRRAIARELWRRYERGMGRSPGQELLVEATEGHLAEADYVLDLLRAHAAPASGEVESLRSRLERERYEWQHLHNNDVQQIKGIEKRAKRAEDQAGKARCERDEALARIAQLEGSLQARPDVVEQLARCEAAVAEAKRKADDHRRQRDEARAQLATAKSQIKGLENWHDEALRRSARAEELEAELERERELGMDGQDREEQLRAQLAACKDEAGKAYGCHQTLLSEAHQTVEQLRAELAEEKRLRESERQAGAILDAEREATASALASVLQSRPTAPEHAAEVAKLRAELQSARAARDGYEHDRDGWRRMAEALEQQRDEARRGWDASRLGLSDCNERLKGTLSTDAARAASVAAAFTALSNAGIHMACVPGKDALVAQIEQLASERDDAIARLKGTLALADERANDKARVEHELLGVRADLERERVNHSSNVESMRRVTAQLREQYETLRSLVEVHDSDRDRPGSINMVHYGNRVHDGARALLQPATPEQSSNHLDRAEWADLDESRALPEPLTEEQRKAALEAMRKDREARRIAMGDDGRWSTPSAHSPEVAQALEIVEEQLKPSRADLHAETDAVLQRVADEQPIAKVLADVKALWRFVEKLAEEPHYANTPEQIGAFARGALDARKAVDRG